MFVLVYAAHLNTKHILEIRLTRDLNEHLYSNTGTLTVNRAFKRLVRHWSNFWGTDWSSNSNAWVKKYIDSENSKAHNMSKALKVFSDDQAKIQDSSSSAAMKNTVSQSLQSKQINHKYQYVQLKRHVVKTKRNKGITIHLSHWLPC